MWPLIIGVADGALSWLSGSEAHSKWWERHVLTCISLEGAPTDFSIDDVMHEKHWSGAAHECMKPYLRNDMDTYLFYVILTIGIFPIMFLIILVKSDPSH